MHVRELVELAALIAANGPLLIRYAERLSESGVEQYWSASKCRHDRWAKALKSYTVQIQQARGTGAGSRGQTIRPVLEEILTAEILARVWAGVCCAHDQRRGAEQVSPIVRNVMAGQLELRHRALNVMVYGHGFCVEEAVTLNRLRRRNERWTDLLLAYLHNEGNVAEFAFNSRRLQDFADDLRHEAASSTPGVSWSLLLASLRASYGRGLSLAAPNADLNRCIASAILSSFQPELFDSTGLLKSLWLERLHHATSDTQGMIDQLLSLDEPTAAAFDPRADRLYRGRQLGQF